MALEKYLLKRQKYYDRLRRELALDVQAMLETYEGIAVIQAARGFYAEPDSFTSYDDPYATAPMPEIRRRSDSA